MHAHNVYISLNDSSEKMVNQFVSDSNLYLAGIKGIRSFSCGTLEQSLQRGVNDRNFDVSVHILFDSKEAHDAYQLSTPHEEFVDRNEGNWAEVRVFDSAILLSV